MHQNDELKSRLSNIRILVVDDEEYVRRDVEKSLQAAGYSVDLASDSKEAIEKISKSHYHLALVDLRMPNFEGHISETAGVDLLRRIKKDFPGLSVIILTGSATIETAIECIKLGALDYFQKGFSSSDLGIRVQKALPDELVARLLQGIPINWNLKITLAKEDIIGKSEDIEIFQRLFYDSQEVKVTLVAKGSSSARIYKVTAQDQNGNWRVPLIVKIGRKLQIQKEILNYETYVKDKLPRYPQLRDPAFTSNRGGIVMPFLNLVAEELKTFRDFFFLANGIDVVETIENLFKENLGYWYRTTRKQEPVFIFQVYSEYLGVEKWDLEQSLKRYLKEFIEADYISLPNSTEKMPNPIPLFNSLRSKYWGYIDDSAFLSVVHGDLNASNVLVDSEHHCWIIDFTRTGKAHILRDFVQFETAIKYSLLDSVDIRERLDFERATLFLSGTDEPFSLNTNDQTLQKALHAIAAIRENAKHITGEEDLFPSYLIALLFHSLDMLRYFEDAVTAESKLCILFATDLIIQKLRDIGLK